MSSITDPAYIAAFRKRTLLAALKMEIAGLKRGGPSAYSIIKQEFGLRGNKQRVYDQLKEQVDKENEDA